MTPAGRHAAAKRETIESFLAFSEGGPPPRWPLEVYLEVSNACDLKCAMCPTFSALDPGRVYWLKADRRGFLETAQVSARLSDVLTHALTVRCSGYGEPTIHPSFAEFVDYVSGFEVLIDFTTNGMHLTDELTDFLVRKGVYKVMVSYSGTTKEEYESVYLGGVSERVLAGIRRLADAKQRHRSAYPVIEVNSLAFQHHVDRLDTFVGLMADHGVDVIHLKALETFVNIPYLQGHAAVLRPDVEGVVLDRARALARQRGVILSAQQFEGEVARSAEEYRAIKERRRNVLADEAAPPLAEIDVPIVKFPELARSLTPHRPGPEHTRRTIPHVLDEPPDRIGDLLRIEPRDGEPFHCMEPFRTFYVRQGGNVKPCCFAADDAPALGNIETHQGDEVWRGQGYAAVRSAILDDQYPMATCYSCLRGRWGPPHHFAEHHIHPYLSWSQAHLRIDPCHGTRRDLRIPSNSEIVERGRLKRFVLAAGLESRDFEGCIDRRHERCIEGWVWSSRYPKLRWEVVLSDGEDECGRVVANELRPDLVRAGIGDGRYAFSLELPDDSRPALVRVAETDYVLPRHGRGRLGSSR